MNKKNKHYQIDYGFEKIDSKIYHQLLDEWSEIVYFNFCQLHKNQVTAPESLALKKAGA